MKRLYTALLLSIVTIPALAQSAEDLFQQAVRVERVSSNPEAAIVIYRQIVDSPSADRELVARAWLQMGKAYEVLGEDGAIRAYSRVVRDYGDLREIAGEASQRMAELAEFAPAKQPNPAPGDVSEIPMPEGWGGFGYGSGVSPDGRWLALVADSPVLHDVNTGEARELPELSARCGDHPFHGEDSINSLRFSEDGQTMAWVCWSGTAGFFDLGTGQIEQLISRDEFYGPGVKTEAEFLDWTPDERGLILKEYERYNIVRVAEPGASPEVVGRFSDSQMHWDNNACVLGSGRYLFSSYRFEDAERGRPHVVGRADLETGELTAAIEDAIREYSLMGCSKAQDLLFYSEGTDQYGALMGARVTPDGQLTDKRFLGDLPLRAWAQPITQNGNVYYPDRSYRNQHRSVIASLGEGASIAVGENRPKGLTLGWSDDGRLRASYGGGWAMHLEDSETGRDWELSLPHYDHRHFDWGPDGTWFMLSSGRQTWRINVYDGSVESLEGMAAQAVLKDGSFLVTEDGEGGKRCWSSLHPGAGSTALKCVDDWFGGTGFVQTSPSRNLVWALYRGKESVRPGQSGVPGADTLAGPMISRVFSLDGEVDLVIEQFDEDMRWVDFLPGDESVLLVTSSGASKMDLRTGEKTPIDIADGGSKGFDRVVVHPDGERLDLWPVGDSRPHPLARIGRQALRVIHDVVTLYDQAKGGEGGD